MDRRRLRELSGGHPRDFRTASYFVRGRDLDPDEISRLTAITADRSWRRGDLKPRTGIPYRDGLWEIKSGLTERDQIHEHLDALIGRLRPAWPMFVELGR